MASLGLLPPRATEFWCHPFMTVVINLPIHPHPLSPSPSLLYIYTYTVKIAKFVKHVIARVAIPHFHPHIVSCPIQYTCGCHPPKIFFMVQPRADRPLSPPLVTLLIRSVSLKNIVLGVMVCRSWVGKKSVEICRKK